MNSDEKTKVLDLLRLERSDLFAFQNITKSVKLSTPDSEPWYAVIQMLPLEFYRIIENYPNMYTTEKFDIKYIRNPKKCAYDRYGTTNMWRPLMILNRCPSINDFNFEYIRYFNIENFQKIISVLISRMN
jgi:hypothetical protein